MLRYQGAYGEMKMMVNVAVMVAMDRWRGRGLRRWMVSLLGPHYMLFSVDLLFFVILGEPRPLARVTGQPGLWEGPVGRLWLKNLAASGSLTSTKAIGKTLKLRRTTLVECGVNPQLRNQYTCLPCRVAQKGPSSASEEDRETLSSLPEEQEWTPSPEEYVIAAARRQELRDRAQAAGGASSKGKGKTKGPLAAFDDRGLYRPGQGLRRRPPTTL
eukprot:s563_g31.t1